MDRAAELARGVEPLAWVVVADFQSNGRGTRGRSWTAPVGSCLMFSFTFRPQVAVGALADLPLRIAAMIRDDLNARYDAQVAVDPPNDLVVGGRKLAGVLCQSHLRAEAIDWVVCGIGLNTNLTATEARVPKSTSLRIATGRTFDHELLLAELLAALDPVRQL